MLGKLIFTNKLVAKNLGIEEKKVAGVMEFVFAELGKEVKECNHPFIYVKGLGTFLLKVSTIEKRLKFILARYKVLKTRDPETKMGKGKLGPQLEGCRKEIFELFRIRRVILTRHKKIRKIRNEKKAGVIVDDSKG